MRTLVIVTALTLSVPACHDGTAPAHEVVAGKDAEAILESTPWLDTLPQDERDHVNAYLFGRGEGLYLVGNQYKSTVELFRYWVDGGTLKLKFLEENKSYDTGWKIERWRGEVFDYRLTLDHAPRGPAVYYGFDSGRALPPVVSKIKALTLPTAPTP